MKFGIEVNLDIEGVEDKDIPKEVREGIKDYALDIIKSFLMNGKRRGYLDFRVEFSDNIHKVSGSWKTVDK